MGNLIGMHSSYCQGTPYAQDLRTAAGWVAQMGPDSIELNPGALLPLGRDGRLELRKHIESLGMTVTLNGGLASFESDIASPEPAFRRAGLHRSREILEACCDMGAPIWSGLIHCVWGERPDARGPKAHREQAWARSVDGMREVAAMAEGYGVVCCLEVVNRYEQYLFNTARDGCAFCAQVGRESCKLLLDTFHMSIEEADLPNAIFETHNQGLLGAVHVGERNRRLPAEGGGLDWDAFGRAVRTSGYTGPLTLEPMVSTAADPSHKACLWRNLEDTADTGRLLEAGRQGVALLRRLAG